MLLAGDFEAVDAIDFTSDVGVDELHRVISAYLDHHNRDEILAFCDLLGGTPFNVTSRLAFGRDRCRVFFGLNIGLLVEAILSRGDDLNELVAHLTDVAPASVGASTLSM